MEFNAKAKAFGPLVKMGRLGGLLLLGLIFVALPLGVLVSCGEEQGGTIVIASKPFTEGYLLAEMMVLLVQENTDIEVQYKPGIAGGTANIHPAMLRGEIDAYPEYTGTGWLSVLGKEAIADPLEMYKAVKAAYAEEFGITWLGMYGFNNGYGVAMRRDQAEELGISSLSDLAKQADKLVFGANADFFERADGFPALEERYELDFDRLVEFTAIGFSYTAIASEQVDAINIFTTDARLKENDLIVLEDDQSLFPTYYAAPLVRSAVLEEHPQLEGVLDSLAGLIDGDTMSQLNFKVEIEKQDPKKVAEDFLRDSGLIE